MKIRKSWLGVRSIPQINNFSHFNFNRESYNEKQLCLSEPTHSTHSFKLWGCSAVHLWGFLGGSIVPVIYFLPFFTLAIYSLQ